MKNRFDSLKDNTNPFKREGNTRKPFNSEHKHDRKPDRNHDRKPDRKHDRKHDRKSDRNFTRPSYEKHDSNTPNNFIVAKPTPPPTFNMKETDFPSLEGVVSDNKPTIEGDKYRSVATKKVKVDRVSSNEVRKGHVNMKWVSNKVEMKKGPPGNWEIKRAEKEREKQFEKDLSYDDNNDSPISDDYNNHENDDYSSEEMDDYFDY